MCWTYCKTWAQITHHRLEWIEIYKHKAHYHKSNFQKEIETFSLKIGWSQKIFIKQTTNGRTDVSFDCIENSNIRRFEHTEQSKKRFDTYEEIQRIEQSSKNWVVFGVYRSRELAKIFYYVIHIQILLCKMR